MNLRIFYSLLGGDLPKGQQKEEMFNYYNSLVGKSEFIKKRESPKTVCGSCIQRVKTNLWKYYHSLPEEVKLQDLEFTGKFVAHNMPRYVKKEIAQG